MLPTGTVTFLFTDIQGSTPLWEREPEKMAAALQVHNHALRYAIEALGGVVFKTVGDAFQAAFPTAPQALRAAIDGQKALLAAEWNELGPLTVRMGLHTGQAEIDPDGDEYAVSHTKNRAARIMSAAQGGQILVSLATVELLRGHLPPQVELQDLGEHHLKGMLQPERIYQAFSPGLPTEAAVLHHQPSAKPNLLEKVIELARMEPPENIEEILDSTIFVKPLTDAEQARYLTFLTFARELQNENSVYESVYEHLLYLYVLNGSRLDLLKSIDRRLRGLAEGESALVLLEGIPGIGKTSLVMAFYERMLQLGAELIVAHGSGQGGLSYSLWQDVAGAAAAVTGRSLEALPAPVGRGKEVHSAQQLKQALAGWLAACAKDQPLVILLDDLHWADADSLEVLDYLTSQTVQPAILFIATYRSDESHTRPELSDLLIRLRRNRKVNHHQLHPLNQDDTARLVTAFLGAASPPLARYLLDRAEGHPLFTVELLNNLISQGLLTQNRSGIWLPPEQSVPVPAFLKQLINQRVARAGSQVEKLLTVCAVAGESWSLSTVEPLVALSEEELLEAVESALGAEIIVTEDEKREIYHFSHGLIREVLYSQQLARRRKRIHELLAEQLEQQQPDQAHKIAHHYFEAERWGKAAGFFLAAGEEANQRFASLSALRLYQQALQAAEFAGSTYPAGQVLTIFDRLARSYRAMGQRKNAERVYSQMRDFAQRSGDLVAEGLALVSLSLVQSTIYRLDLAEKTARDALKLGEKTGDISLLAHVHASLGGIALLHGQLEEAAHHYAEVQRHAEQMGDSNTLLDVVRYQAYQSIWTGHYSEGIGYANQAYDLALRSADTLVIIGANQNLAFAQIESGQYLGAFETLQNTLETIAASGVHHHQKPRFLNMMGYLYLELGSPGEALAWDRKALEAIQDTDLIGIEMQRYSLLNQATDFLHLGRLAEAQEIIAQFESILEGADYARFRYFNRYQLLMCEVHLVLGAFEQAIAFAQQARSLAQPIGVRKNIAKSHWLEGQALAGIRRFAEAVDHLQEAVEMVDRIQHGSLRWKIRLSLAEALRGAGKPAEAVIQQARVLMDQTASSLAGSPLQRVFLDSQWVKRLAELEQDQAPIKPTYPAGLTEREIEVLRLVAGGATNQQVAEVLNISVRTVNTHMTNILNKTSCENRTAATAFAVQHHLVST